MFIVTGPLLGYALDSYGMSTTLLAMALLFAPLFMLVIAGLGVNSTRKVVSISPLNVLRRV